MSQLKKQPFTPIPCHHPGCKYVPIDRKHEVRHARVHSDEQAFACTYDGCEVRTKDPKSLRDHVRNIHLKIRPHSCHVCDKKWFSRTNLRKHLTSHRNDGHDAYQCPVCQPVMQKKIVIRTESIELAIKRRNHLLAKAKERSQRQRLKARFGMHRNSKPIKCHVCPNSFSTTGNFVSHMWTHVRNGHNRRECKSCQFILGHRKPPIRIRKAKKRPRKGWTEWLGDEDPDHVSGSTDPSNLSLDPSPCFSSSGFSESHWPQISTEQDSETSDGEFDDDSVDPEIVKQVLWFLFKNADLFLRCLQ